MSDDKDIRDLMARKDKASIGFTFKLCHSLAEMQGEMFKRLTARIERLEERAEKSLKYRGVWQPAEVYQEGDCVTRDGSLWIACKGTRDRPGTADSGWQLATKSGRE